MKKFLCSLLLLSSLSFSMRQPTLQLQAGQARTSKTEALGDYVERCGDICCSHPCSRYPDCVAKCPNCGPCVAWCISCASLTNALLINKFYSCSDYADQAFERCFKCEIIADSSSLITLGISACAILANAFSAHRKAERAKLNRD